METYPLICGANQWTGFYMISDSVMKELSDFQIIYKEIATKRLAIFLMENGIDFLLP